MKHRLLLLIVFIGLGLFAQQRPKLRTDLSEGNKRLQQRLQAEYAQRQARVDSFCLQKPDTQRRFTDDKGRICFLFDIEQGQPVYYVDYNIDAARATRASELHSGGDSGLNLNGEGIYLGVWDGGMADADHDEFLDDTDPDHPVQRVLAMEDVTPTKHTTHVTGSVVAKGKIGQAKGMAPKAIVKVYKNNNAQNEVFVEANAQDNPILMSNHSYGPGFDNINDSAPWKFGTYTQQAQNWDDIMYENPGYLQVQAAGNYGKKTNVQALSPDRDKLPGPTTAKNSLVVANASPVFSTVSNPIEVSIHASSSEGPTDDLRIKPDIASDGTGVYSTLPGNNYKSSVGTSMAAPVAMGSISLLQQYYRQKSGSYMLASTLKGLVCHSAFEDGQSLGPDPHFGWGFIDVRHAANLITKKFNVDDHSVVIDERTLTEGGVYRVNFNVPAQSEVIATLCWTDPPGELTPQGAINSPTPHLVNNLDVKITSSAGTIYYPWRLQLNGETLTAVQSAPNNVDNVERINFISPADDTYTLTISHNGKLLNSIYADPTQNYEQVYSLILSGEDLVLSAAHESLSERIGLYPNPAQGEVTLELGFVKSSVEVVVFGIDGKRVLTRNFDGSLSAYRIDIRTLLSGIYFVRVRTAHGEVIKKLIVR